MNTFEDEMLDRAANRMSREIDSEIINNTLIEMLTKDGWTPTKVNPAFPEYGMLNKPFEEWYSQTAEWIHKNAQGDYKLVKGQWLFKDPKDATMFILRWS
jgi:hypothetical protein